MDALTLLLNRSSQPRLEAPAPSGDALENIMQAAVHEPAGEAVSPEVADPVARTARGAVSNPD